jgi:hypothetical protein
VIDDDAPGGESGPQGQPRDSNERRLETVRQIERELDALFAVAIPAGYRSVANGIGFWRKFPKGHYSEAATSLRDMMARWAPTRPDRFVILPPRTPWLEWWRPRVW